LVYLIHQIYVTLDSGHCSARLFFADFKKAFDRQQCVKIGNVFSSLEENNSSLPQGAKLGPLLFVFLINSLLADWQGRIRYVDDTTTLEIIQRCSENKPSPEDS
jgi:hypothetical protein